MRVLSIRMTTIWEIAARIIMLKIIFSYHACLPFYFFFIRVSGKGVCSCLCQCKFPVIDYIYIHVSPFRCVKGLDVYLNIRLRPKVKLSYHIVLEEI